MTAEDVLDFVTSAELVELGQVNRSTAVRWKNRTSRAPGAVLKLAALLVLGELSALLGPDWSGFRLGRDRLLYVPGWRRGYAPGELAALPYVHAELATQRTRVRELEARLHAHQVGTLRRVA